METPDIVIFYVNHYENGFRVGKMCLISPKTADIMEKNDVFMGKNVNWRGLRGIQRNGMKEEIKSFIEYLDKEKGASQNTQVSYRRDLVQLATYLEKMGVTEAAKVTKTMLNSYVLHLEKEGKASTTVSRMLASMKAFFSYEFKSGKIKKDPADMIRAPRIEKKMPTILSIDAVNRLMEQPSGTSAKEIRDRAMLELLYATGIRVSELIHLKLEDVNMSIGFITCRDEHKERTVPFGRVAKEALSKYLALAREELLKGNESSFLFTNCSGGPMSRQGFWKIIKYYGNKAGIEEDITPHTLRHSFAAHLIGNGADMRAVQTMMGHSDLATTQMYAAYAGTNAVREAYQGAHPRR